MNMSSREFQNRVALITGGARNIGFSVAKDLGARGAAIVIADVCRNLETIPYKLSSKRDLDTAVQELAKLGISAMGIVCDVRDEKQVVSAIHRIVKEFGRLDILVNNAGVVSLSPVSQLTEQAWDEVVDVCLKGSFLCCKHAVPHMIEQHYGKIVNISSVAGSVGIGTGVHYCAAKHGVIGITKALAMEVADHNINVNAVCPGTTESPMLDGLASQIGLESDAYPHFSQRHLFRDRKVTPKDVAQTVRWLVSDESHCLTGAIIHVDAGWVAAG
jgi:NAD(P)-dependent dehydrogenase (short-subunit alcohol dehydrogenase family)